MADEKIYLTSGDSSNGMNAALIAALQNKGIDPSVLALANNAGFGGFGNGNDLLGLIILFAIFGGGFGNGFGWGGGNGSSTEREMIMSAIQRNGQDVNSIAQSLNVSSGQVNAGINALALQLANMAGQQGLSAQQVINSIQAGNTSLASQLANCCCENRMSTMQQGYESRIANLEQTGVLAEKSDQNTNAIVTKIADQTALIQQNCFDQQLREAQDKIDAERQKNSELASKLSVLEQTNALERAFGAQFTTVNNTLAAIQAQLNAGAAVKTAGA